MPLLYVRLRRLPGRCVVPTEDVFAQLIELTGGDRRTDLIDQPDGEALVVDGAQRRGQHLLGLEQVVDIGTGVVRAGVAIALVVDRG